MRRNSSLITIFILSLLSSGYCEDPAAAADDDDVNCDAVELQNDCEQCVKINGCVYIKYKEESETCQSINQDPADGAELFRNVTQCQEDHGDLPFSTVTPSSDDNTTTTTVNPENTTTTEITTTPTTTTTVTTTTAPDNTTTTTPTTTSSTTTPTTTTVTTTASTTSTSASTTAAPAPQPDSRGHFDGWSFFGGILLTLGIAAIGFVGFKYYKLRSSSGGNYNRF